MYGGFLFFIILSIDVSTDNPMTPDAIVTAAPDVSTMTPDALISQSPSPTKNAKYCAYARYKKNLPSSTKVQKYCSKKHVLSMSPNSKKQIFLELLKTSPELKSLLKSNSRKSQVSHSLVTKFYEDESVELPDKKFFSRKLNKQRKVLKKPITLLHQDFKIKYPSAKISLSSFFKLRPKHVLKMKSLKFSQCLCEVCENMRLMLNVLKANGAQFVSVDDALKMSLCDFDGHWAKLDCVHRKCDGCGVHIVHSLLKDSCNVTASVAYKIWRLIEVPRAKTKKYRLVSATSSISELIDQFCSQLKTFSLHSFMARWQRTQFNNLRDNLPDDLALVVIDFAENYVCHYQNQVQAAYYDLPQVVIHPVVIYTKCPSNHILTSYRIYISDDRCRDSSFVKYVLNDTMSSIDKSRFVIFSDNCGQQYKSRLPLHHIRELSSKFQIERSFFVERHGKNECDAVSGVVKPISCM